MKYTCIVSGTTPNVSFADHRVFTSVGVPSEDVPWTQLKYGMCEVGTAREILRVSAARRFEQIWILVEKVEARVRL
jgi:hypothetical protein